MMKSQLFYSYNYTMVKVRLFRWWCCVCCPVLLTLCLEKKKMFTSPPWPQQNCPLWDDQSFWIELYCNPWTLDTLGKWHTYQCPHHVYATTTVAELVMPSSQSHRQYCNGCRARPILLTLAILQCCKVRYTFLTLAAWKGLQSSIRIPCTDCVAMMTVKAP